MWNVNSIALRQGLGFEIYFYRILMMCRLFFRWFSCGSSGGFWYRIWIQGMLNDLDCWSICYATEWPQLLPFAGSVCYFGGTSVDSVRCGLLEWWLCVSISHPELWIESCFLFVSFWVGFFCCCFFKSFHWSFIAHGFYHAYCPPMVKHSKTLFFSFCQKWYFYSSSYTLQYTLHVWTLEFYCQ